MLFLSCLDVGSEAYGELQVDYHNVICKDHFGLSVASETYGDVVLIPWGSVGWFGCSR